MLADLLGRCFGRLDIVIERSRVRRFCPVRSVRRPGLPRPDYPPSSGEWELWAAELSACLDAVMGAGWGTVTLVIEHGKVACIEAAPSIPAAGGTQLAQTTIDLD